MIHGKSSSYKNGCNCSDCRRAHRFAMAEAAGREHSAGEEYDRDWVIVDFPIEIIVRHVVSDDELYARI